MRPALFSRLAIDCNLQLVAPDKRLLSLRGQRGIVKLNSVCAEVWSSLIAGETEEQIAKSLTLRYGVGSGKAKDDVRAFVERIRELRLFPAEKMVSTSVAQV